MKTLSHRRSWQKAWLLACVFFPLSSFVHAAGFSEPNVTLYGKITNTGVTPPEIVHTGVVTWTVTPPAGSGAPFNVAADVQNLGGGDFSYRVEIPAEKLPSGSVLSGNTVEASTATKTYSLGASVDGSAAILVAASGAAHSGATTYNEVLRGKLERIDLKISAAPLDSDGDGIPDSWEIQYGLNPYDPSDAFGDADGDGVVNIAEYQDGTDPTCFEWIRWLAANGFDAANPALSGPNADPDKDGIPNLLEYALGTDPRTPDAALARARSKVNVQTFDGQKYLTITAVFPSTRHCNADYIVETSSDLTSWGAVSGTDVIALTTSPEGFIIRDAAYLGQPGKDRRFIRLKVLAK